MIIKIQLMMLAPVQEDNSQERNQSKGLNKKSTKRDCIASKNAFIFKIGVIFTVTKV